MSTKKTIQINPELFKIPGKTKKNREKKELSINPILNPSSLKNKLLNRIKELKKGEIKNSQKQQPVPNTTTDSDEFNEALGYLSDLKKKQKINKLNQLKQKALQNKTLKADNIYNDNTYNGNIYNDNTYNGNTYNGNKHNINISLDLPPELTEPIKPLNNDIFKMNYKTDDEVPYGCLKGGHKKTYREWKELTNPVKDVPDMIRPPTPPKKNTLGTFLEGAYDPNAETQTTIKPQSREERLEQIKAKLKKMQDAETTAKQESIEKFKKLETQLTNPLLASLENKYDTNLYNEYEDNNEEIEKLIQERDKKINDKPKKYVKKTTKQKFTLGKSKNLRHVSVLIKNRQTRKNIIDTQKELKKTDMTDVRKYLRQHGMIKVGSTCPADILRKTFETAVLTGEVNNTNKETLLHNFLSGADKI